MPLPKARPPPVAYASAHTPLLTQLHERLTDYENAIDAQQGIYSKYGLNSSLYRPAPIELERRMQRTADTFDTVLEHVEDVDAHVESDYVVLQRDRCGPANGLFSTPRDAEAIASSNEHRMVHTPSVILQHSRSLSYAFPPRPSCEVLMRSKILANSVEIRMLSAPELRGL